MYILHTQLDVHGVSPLSVLTQGMLHKVQHFDLVLEGGERRVITLPPPASDDTGAMPYHKGPEGSQTLSFEEETVAVAAVAAPLDKHRQTLIKLGLIEGAGGGAGGGGAGGQGGGVSGGERRSGAATNLPPIASAAPHGGRAGGKAAAGGAEAGGGGVGGKPRSPGGKVVSFPAAVMEGGGRGGAEARLYGRVGRAPGHGRQRPTHTWSCRVCADPGPQGSD